MPYRDYGGRDRDLNWGDRDFEDRDFEGQWRVYGRPSPERDRERNFDRERYQRTFGRGRDQPHDAFYGRDRYLARSPEASRYDAEDFGGGAYDRDFARRYDEWHGPFHAQREDLAEYDYAGYGRGSYGLGGRYGSRSRLETGRGFFGRGPRGYRKSDQRITEDICERLAYDPDLDASDIEVRVESGIVTLSGIVEDREAKRLAEDIVEEVIGVDDVNNSLKVRQGLWGRVTGDQVSEREVSREAEREGTARPASETAGRSRTKGKESTRTTR